MHHKTGDWGFQLPFKTNIWTSPTLCISIFWPLGLSAPCERGGMNYEYARRHQPSQITCFARRQNQPRKNAILLPHFKVSVMNRLNGCYVFFLLFALQLSHVLVMLFLKEVISVSRTAQKLCLVKTSDVKCIDFWKYLALEVFREEFLEV